MNGYFHSNAPELPQDNLVSVRTITSNPLVSKQTVSKWALQKKLLYEMSKTSSYMSKVDDLKESVSGLCGANEDLQYLDTKNQQCISQWNESVAKVSATLDLQTEW